jgi:3-dehydroquinate synthase
LNKATLTSVSPILIGPGAISELAQFLKTRKSKKIYLISDLRLTSMRQKILKLLAAQGFEAHELPVKAGEGLKDIHSVYPLYGELLKKKADRDSLIIALGGGSVGDVAGFIAATYLRGIDWVGLPTTLLAQVDSSVGGKTGINHSAGKNLIGAFHQPALVICDTNFLKTLGAREITSGIGEIVKYALTFDPKFFSYLETNLPQLQKLDSKTLQYCIQRSLEFKADAVAQDEHDRTGIREVLNFGHTFGHALESATSYQKYQHGEAVIWGMRFAVALSAQRGHLPSLQADRVNEFLARLKVPAFPKNLTREKIFSYLKKDKKNENGKIRFVLLDRLGRSVSDKEVTPKDLNVAYAALTRKGRAHEK